MKNRKDIPDAFIFEALKKIAEKDEVHFIVEDDNLKTKCNLESNIIGHSSFDEFFKHSAFNPVKRRHEELQKTEELKAKLLNRLDYVVDLTEDYFLNRFEEESFEDEYLPSDNKDGSVVGIEHIVTVDLYSSEVKFIDDNFYLSASVLADCLVEYTIFKSDYHILDESRKIHVSELNNHYYDAQEHLPIRFDVDLVVSKNDVEEDLDYELKINFNDISIGEPHYTELYSLDRKPFDLKANQTEKVVLTQEISIEDKILKFEYAFIKTIKKRVKIKCDLYNAEGVRISKTVLLDNHGVTEFRMLTSNFFSDNFQFIELTSNSNIEVNLSIFKYVTSL